MRIRYLLLALLAMTGAAACQPGEAPATVPEETAQPAEPPADPALGPDAETVDAVACAAQGGERKPVCRMQQPMCLITYPDAGKVCSDSSECGGRCLAAVDAPAGTAAGTCSQTNDPCGCYVAIEGGVAQPAICVD